MISPDNDRFPPWTVGTAGQLSTHCGPSAGTQEGITVGRKRPVRFRLHCFAAAVQGAPSRSIARTNHLITTRSGLIADTMQHITDREKPGGCPDDEPKGARLSDRGPVHGKRATVRRMPRHDLPGMRTRSRWFVLLAALLAFSWQSIVVETHFHSPSESASAGVIVKQGAHGQPAQRRAPSDSPAGCPICRELAHAHNYLPPAPTVFEAPRPGVSPVLSASSNELALPQRWHGWRSRAPPFILQA
jgi:hypothetical protein